jgi:CubicO group peptidase (beta-lactamase class C family)
MLRRAPLIAAAMALQSLAGCHDAPSRAHASPTTAVIAPGVPGPAMEEAIDALFADPAAGETRALLVLRDGKPVAERYGAGFGPGTRQIGWSMSKCVTGLLVGLLVADGRLRLDAPAPVPAWQRAGDPRGAITLRMLLQMRAGLKHVESTEPVYAADTAKMLFLEGRDDMAAYAEGQPLETPAGARFLYSTADSVILADLAARVLAPGAPPEARRQAVAQYLQSRLFEPARLSSMLPEFDARGTMEGGSMIWATARDWGGLGELLRHDGIAGGAAGGAQVIPRNWIAFMRSASPANPAYGGQLWLNHASTVSKQNLFPGRAPSDLFACIGHRGQYVIVSPSQQLTLVRLGISEGEPNVALREHLLAILRLFPRD